MCKACIILMLLCMLPLRAVSDVLEHALVRSGYVHSPLTSVSGISLEAEADAKPVHGPRKALVRRCFPPIRPWLCCV